MKNYSFTFRFFNKEAAVKTWEEWKTLSFSTKIFILVTVAATLACVGGAIVAIILALPFILLGLCILFFALFMVGIWHWIRYTLRRWDKEWIKKNYPPRQ